MQTVIRQLLTLTAGCPELLCRFSPENARQMNIYQQILTRFWGYSDFRPEQEDIIKSVAAGHDTLGLLPTGGGKSVTFQVPTLAGDGMCLVITPLIALMKDQVEKLNQMGIRAMALHSGLYRDEIDVGLNNAVYGDFKFLYVSPERLSTEILRLTRRIVFPSGGMISGLPTCRLHAFGN